MLTGTCGTTEAYGHCSDFDCLAERWTGPEGLTADDLRFSVVIQIERPWKVGDHWPRPLRLDGVVWEFCRREACEDEEVFYDSRRWMAFVYGAAMDREQFATLVYGFECEGESGGLLHPSEAESWWAPSVVYEGDNTSLCVTAWPKARAELMGPDTHLFDEWEAILPLLTGKE